MLLVTRWLLDDIGDLEKMDAINRGKAAVLYRLLDENDGFYRARAAANDRSLMNVAFNLASLELEKRFIAGKRWRPSRAWKAIARSVASAPRSTTD